jgi:hypothetical protein
LGPNARDEFDDEFDREPRNNAKRCVSFRARTAYQSAAQRLLFASEARNNAKRCV